MLTSFFSKTKPANTVVVLLYMTIGFLGVHLVAFKEGYGITDLLRIVGLWLLYVFTMFILNFVVQKNELTKRTSYRIILFAAFTLAFPEALLQPKLIISGLFIILALRRILSLRSGRHMERKLFNAGLWIGLATLVFFWSHLFIIVLLGALIFYGRTSFRYWIIPWLAVISIAVLTTCYFLYLNQSIVEELNLIEKFSFDFTAYSNLNILIPIAFLCSLFLWAIWSFVKEYSHAVIAQKPLYILIIILTMVSLAVVVFAANKTGAEWYFVAIPLAIVVTSFFENAASKWIPEVVLWLIVLLPLTYYFL